MERFYLKEARNFLTQINYYPIDVENGWKEPILIEHARRSTKKIEKKFKEKTKEAKCNVNGLYIYIKGKDPIYVGQSLGKTSTILKRLNDHRKEITDKNKKRWHCFFSNEKNCGQLQVFWRKENDSLWRDSLEKMLTYVLKPSFCKCTKECYKLNLNKTIKRCSLHN